MVRTSSGSTSDITDKIPVETTTGEKDNGFIYHGENIASSVNERKLIRKIDWTLIPWLSFLYFLSFLDRTSIGNAKVFVTDDNGCD